MQYILIHSVHLCASVLCSVPFSPLVASPNDYASEPLMFDGAARGQLLAKLAELGSAIQGAFNGQAQDIEGVVSGGQFYVVQARPQVMNKN